MVSKIEYYRSKIILLLLLAGVAMGCETRNAGTTSTPGDPATGGSLTDVAGLRVGHYTRAERPTGCTVILAMQGATAGVDVRGAAPGTRETDLLRPENTVQQVHAIVLAGGSAFGLAAATGTVRWLEEHGVGFPTGVANVPIVPAAILFDLAVGDPTIRPDEQCGYLAAQAATSAPVEVGDIGAGAGATVGKLAGMDRAMKAGVGTAALKHPDGLVVAALAVVNAFGDIVDPATGKVIAGVRTPDGRQLADARVLIRAGVPPQGLARAPSNTTLVVVATNAKLTKTEATKVAQMAHDGLARAIAPVHTPLDGDIVFALATGVLDGPADVLTIGALAADAVADAIVSAARHSQGLPGLPAAHAIVTASPPGP